LAAHSSVALLAGPLGGLSVVVGYLALFGLPGALLYAIFIDETRRLRPPRARPCPGLKWFPIPPRRNLCSRSPIGTPRPARTFLRAPKSRYRPCRGSRVRRGRTSRPARGRSPRSTRRGRDANDRQR